MSFPCSNLALEFSPNKNIKYVKLCAIKKHIKKKYCNYQILPSRPYKIFRGCGNQTLVKTNQSLWSHTKEPIKSIRSNNITWTTLAVYKNTNGCIKKNAIRTRWFEIQNGVTRGRLGGKFRGRTARRTRVCHWNWRLRAKRRPRYVTAANVGPTRQTSNIRNERFQYVLECLPFSKWSVSS